MRRVQQTVPLAECKRRCLAYMQDRNYRDRSPMKASEVAVAIWPSALFHSQGAGAAASRILKWLQKDGLVCWTSISVGAHRRDWGWILTQPQELQCQADIPQSSAGGKED
jgi:hypothetical protein